MASVLVELYLLGLVSVILSSVFSTVISEEHKRRLGAALNVGRRRLNSEESKRFGDVNEYGIQNLEDGPEPIDKRQIGAALNRLSYQYFPFEEADKRRIGSAKNVRFGSWYYGKPSEKRRLGAALNQGYGDYPSYYTQGKRGIGPALNAVRQDLWLNKDNGKRLEPALNSVLLGDTDFPFKLDGKRRLGSALNTRYKSWLYNRSPNSRKKREADDTQEADGVVAVEDLTGKDKRRLGSALNVRYGLSKKENIGTHDSADNSLVTRDQMAPVAEWKLPISESPITLDANTLEGGSKGGETEGDGHLENEKRPNSISNTIKLEGMGNDATESVNKDSRITAEDNLQKRRLGAALNVATLKANEKSSEVNNEKRRLGSALNVKYSYGWTGDDKTSSATDKRRLGAALNVGKSFDNRYTQYSGPANQNIDNKNGAGFSKRRLGAALNTKYQSRNFRPNEDKRRLGNALNVLAKPYESGTYMGPEKRRIGAALNAMRQSLQLSGSKNFGAEKRRLGAALNVGMNTAGGRLEGSSSSPQWWEAGIDKRRIGSALNAKYKAWLYKDSHENSMDESKRRIGSALNARYKGLIGRTKRSPISNDDRQKKTRVKRFLGAALNARFRKFGNSLTHMAYFQHGSRWARNRLKRDAQGNDELSIVPVGEVNELTQGNGEGMAGLGGIYPKDKRHLGSLIRVGSPFPMTKFSPSKYLRKIDPHEDMAKYYQRQIGQETPSNDMTKAQMYKFYG